MDREFIWISLIGGLIPLSLIYTGGWGALQHPVLLIMFVSFIIVFFGGIVYLFGPEPKDATLSAKVGKKDIKQEETYIPSIERTQNDCEILLNKKGYDLWANSPEYLVLKKDNMTSLFNSKSLNSIYDWALKAKDISNHYTSKNTETEEDKCIKSIAPNNFDDSY